MDTPAARLPRATRLIWQGFAALVLSASALSISSAQAAATAQAVGNAQVAAHAPPTASAQAADNAIPQIDIPAELSIAAPAPLDTLFALVHSVVFDQPHANDPRWLALYREVRARDKAFYDASQAESLADNDARRPVFPPDAGAYHPDMHERLREWAIAYRAGLPEVVESEQHFSPTDLREDAEGSQYIFTPLEYRPAALREYADALDALSIPVEQTALWHSGGVTVLIIATNTLDQYELRVDKTELEHVDLHTQAIFRTGPVETLVDTEGRHILLLPVQPVGMVVYDNGETAAERSYEDIPVNDGDTIPVSGQDSETLRGAERVRTAI